MSRKYLLKIEYKYKIIKDWTLFYVNIRRQSFKIMEAGDFFNKRDKFDFEDNIIKTFFDYEPGEGGLGVEFFRCMKMYRNNVAQYMADTGEEDTYDSLLRRSVRTALKLASQDLAENDLICLCTYNHLNSCVPFIAALFLGLKVASLDPSLSVNDTAHLLKQVTPRKIFVVPEAVQLIEEALVLAGTQAELVVFGPTDKYEPFERYLEQSDKEEKFQPVQVASTKNTTVVFFSSGTTGLPKGICQSHYALICQGINLMYIGRIGANWSLSNSVFSNNGIVTAVTLAYSSLYWISAVLFLTAAIFSGTARVVCKTFDVQKIWHIIDKYKVTCTFLAPNQATDMTKSDRPEGINTTSLLCLVTGGSAVNEKYLMQLRDLLPGTFVSQGYGQTEVAGMLSAFRMNNVKDNLFLHRKPNSCGRPIPGIYYKVVDPDTEQILGPNQQGELRVKSKFAMNGYYNQDSSTSFDSEGWLKTGDIVFYDETQCFYIVDRLKEMLKYRSWHVPPAVIENVLQLHPAVRKAVVIGIPHEEDGDHPMAIVQLNEDAKDITAEEIEDFVAKRVDDRQKLRAGIKFVNNFQMTPSGKIKRQDLKKMVLNGEI